MEIAFLSSSIPAYCSKIYYYIISFLRFSKSSADSSLFCYLSTLGLNIMNSGFLIGSVASSVSSSDERFSKDCSDSSSD